jgi:predicted nicotinamide N-methyase
VKPSDTNEELRALEASLRRRFRTAESDVCVADHELSILHPANADDLISEEDFVRDERLPYWADIWPSSQILAARLLDMRGEGRSLLELGCGAGLVSTCASLAGFDVTASDYYDDALLFSRVNAYRNDAPPIRAIPLDWRNIPEDAPRFDFIVASDVLYERQYGQLIAETIAKMLAPEGIAIVADPGRVARGAFLDALGPTGLRIRANQARPWAHETIKQTITLYELGNRKTT